MKSKQQKQKEALERAKKYKWNNSRAKRKGTATQEQWEERLNKLLHSCYLLKIANS